MQKSCVQCAATFTVTDDDVKFYARMDVPSPEMCPACRCQNRTTFRNEQKFYPRTCDLCQKQMISLYSKEKPYTVYCLSCWWSDKYDPLEYGKNFDFSRPFFTQFEELANSVPKPAIMNMKSENCEYTNYSSENRNCYILIGSAYCENSYYSYRLFTCKDVVDCYDLHTSELCYECTQSHNLYNCLYCNSCENSSDLFLCRDCIGCHNCFGCIGLKNKEYCISNHPYTKEEYEVYIANLKKNPEVARKQFETFKINMPRKATRIINCQNCSGDQLNGCKNCYGCFSTHNSEECGYVIHADRNHFCSDVNFTDASELVYNSMSCEQGYNVIGANTVWFSSNVIYGTHCFNSKNLFGCIGMKKHEYCVLNKRYTKEEYEKLVPQIIKHMKETEEWGKYYPITSSPFAYNETVAFEYFPMTKEEALAKNLKWKDDMYELPGTAPQDAVTCEITGRPFKYTPQELKSYEKMNIARPKVHPFERHQRRMAPMIKFRLYERSCAKCKTPVQSVYAQNHQAIIYCDRCYLESVD